MNQYELGDKVEVHSLPTYAVAVTLSGMIGTIVALPGYDQNFKECYGLSLSIGIINAHPKFLRPYPPKLPNGRGDINKKTSWAEFDTFTGYKSAKFREGYDDSLVN